MKAYVLHNIGDIRYEDYENPIPKSDEIILKVKAKWDMRIWYSQNIYFRALVNHAHQGMNLPALLLKSEHRGWSLFHFWCFSFTMQNLCNALRKLWNVFRLRLFRLRNNGGFAEFVAVPAWNLIPLPDQVNFRRNAMIEPMAVAVHAMRKIAPKPDDFVTVCGLGTIGLLLIMFLKDTGIKNILAIGNKDFQKEKAFATPESVSKTFVILEK